MKFNISRSKTIQKMESSILKAQDQLTMLRKKNSEIYEKRLIKNNKITNISSIRLSANGKDVFLDDEGNDQRSSYDSLKELTDMLCRYENKNIYLFKRVEKIYADDKYQFVPYKFEIGKCQDKKYMSETIDLL